MAWRHYNTSIEAFYAWWHGVGTGRVFLLSQEKGLFRKPVWLTPCKQIGVQSLLLLDSTTQLLGGCSRTALPSIFSRSRYCCYHCWLGDFLGTPVLTDTVARRKSASQLLAGIEASVVAPKKAFKNHQVYYYIQTCATDEHTIRYYKYRVLKSSHSWVIET